MADSSNFSEWRHRTDNEMDHCSNYKGLKWSLFIAVLPETIFHPGLHQKCPWAVSYQTPWNCYLLPDAFSLACRPRCMQSTPDSLLKRSGSIIQVAPSTVWQIVRTKISSCGGQLALALFSDRFVRFPPCLPFCVRHAQILIFKLLNLWSAISVRICNVQN